MAKLRKAPTTSTTNTPALELLLDFTDNEKDRPRKDKKKGAKEEKQEKEREKFAKGIIAQREKQSSVNSHRTPPPQSPPDEEEEKKLLGGLLRFRTRSKERKAAAKQALQKVSSDAQTSVPLAPARLQTPPPLPIATRFARANEEVSFRLQPSETSHGGYGSSSDTHDIYPRPRDRSSRFERPHPVWRSGPSTLGNVGNASSREEKEKVLPAERHALPPNQSIFDRQPAKRPLRIDVSNTATPTVNMEAVNKYYGITTERAHTPAPSTPVPQSHLALAQALEPAESRPLQHLKNTSSIFTPTVPSSPSPFLVPSPNPAQAEFGVQLRAKRGRMNIPPPLEQGFVLPKRVTGSFNPPPTPPPTMDLPPIPTNIPEGPQRTSPYSLVPPSSMRPPSASPLRMNMSHPNLRVEPSTPSPLSLSHQERPAHQTSLDSGISRPVSPLRSLSPVQRGKTPAFPARPVTPTRPVTPSRQGQAGSPLPSSPRPAGKAGSGDSGYRRPEYDPTMPPARKSSVSNEDRLFIRPSRSQLFLKSSTDAYPGQEDQSYNNNADMGGPVPPARKRSLRKTNNNQSGYDSDGSSSRYSRDTYYGRETAYFDDQNMPPLPHLSNMPPLPQQRDFGDMERERKAGRERLVRMLANGGREF